MQPRRLEECKVFSRNMRKTDLNLFIFTRGFISQNYVKDFRFITFEIYLMDSKRIHEDITHLFNKVVEQYSRILQYENSVPIMEIDLALKDVRDLYESMLDLRTLSEIQRRKSLETDTISPSNVEKPKESTSLKPKTSGETISLGKMAEYIKKNGGNVSAAESEAKTDGWVIPGAPKPVGTLGQRIVESAGWAGL